MLFVDTSFFIKIGIILFYISPLFTALSILLFSNIFPDNPGYKNKKLYALFTTILSIILLITILTSLFIKEISINSEGINSIKPNMFLFYPYVIFIVSLFILTYKTLIFKILNSQGVTKKQLTYIFLGTFFSTNIAVYTNIYLPILGEYSYVWVGPPATIFASLSIGYAIFKYGLFDVRSTVLRWLFYIFVIFIFTGLYSILINIISTLLFGLERASITEILVGSIVAMTVALTFQPLRLRFDKFTNRIFFQDQYNPQQSLNNLNASLVSTSRIGELINRASLELSETLHPTSCGIFLDGENNNYISSELEINETFTTKLIDVLKLRKQKTTYYDFIEEEYIKNLFKNSNIKLACKLVVQNQLVGFIILGERKSGNSYTEKDIQFIETAADSIAIATQNALRYEEIAAFNANLQKKIDIATADLRKTNEKLKALDEAKDDFISMASHQLRTPLTSVKGYLSMVLEGDAGPINDLQRKFLSQSFISSQRMVFLISDLLNASRLKTGKFVIENKETYIPDIVGEELSQLEETIKARGLTLEYKKPKSFPVVNIDENKIRQVIMNFVDNAIYYTPSGGKIVVKLRATHEVIEYTVQDSGIGVPKEDQKHLFTKFYRAGNAKKARPDGTGLGIFMAKKVIIAQGGALIFKSEEGKGSVFGFSFPLKKIKIK